MSVAGVEIVHSVTALKVHAKVALVKREIAGRMHYSGLLATGNFNVWLPLSGLVLGVLLWNFPSPRTFLGDGGSTLLGYICASHLLWSIFPDLFGSGFISLSFVLLFIGGVPVIDTLIAMTRRIITKKSPFSPDRGHAHHKLQDAGLSKTVTLLVMGVAHFTIVTFGLNLIGFKFFDLF